LNKAPVIAAIDIGTNSFHLVVASVNNRGMMKIFTREKEVVRLGSSGRDMKLLQPDAIERGVRTLKNFTEIAKSQKAEIRAVATSAVREAENKYEFIERVKNELGVDIEIISGAEEGRLIFIGAMHALPLYSQKSLVIDIGGGSTETIIGFNGQVNYVHSAKLGAIRLSKMFFPDDTITEKQIEECRNYIRGEWFPTMSALDETGFTTVVGTSGTIQNIAAMAVAAKGEKLPDVLNGLTVSGNEILLVIKKITKCKTLKQRAEIPGIDSTRADIIVGGALILEHALKTLKIQNILISSYALREGIVFDTVQKMKDIQEYRHLSHLRFDTITGLCQRYNVDIVHAEHVKDLSLAIFDGIQSLHELGCECRELLEAAALLHDAGYYISHDQHHKHSFYIISQCIMPGFTNNEAELIANIARYHRKSHPKKKHENFEKLSDIQKRTVSILAGILRISEGLDRRRMQVVKLLKARIENEEIIISIFCEKNNSISDIEEWGANRRKALLEETFNKKVKFELHEKNAIFPVYHS